MLECKDITVNYQGKTVLDHCNLSIKKGEIVGIMGESGSGKSTLARVILGIEKPTQGQVLLDGKTYSIDVYKRQVSAFFHFYSFIWQKGTLQKVF